jgi:hypothetical protein
MDNACSGAPVDSLARFKAYHYASASVLLLSLGWFVLVMRATSPRLRPAAFFAAAFWVSINCYWVYLFLRNVRSDISSTYYKTMWNPLGRWL